MGNDRLAGWGPAGGPLAAVLGGLAGNLLGGLVGGLLAGLALPPLDLPPLDLPPLLWLALVPLWALAGSGPGLTALAGGALWGGAAVLVSHRWLLGLHPLDWIGVPGPLSLPLALLLLLICALAGALLVAVWVGLARWLDPRRPSSALLVSGVWGLVEVALAKGPLFWLGLGAAALPGDRLLAGLAALGGSGLLAAVQLLLGWCLWRCCIAAATRRRWLLISMAALLLSHGLGAAALLANPGAAGGETAEQPNGLERVLVLQPAIPTREKFQWAQQRRLQQRLTTALAEAEQQQADLVVLPEGALGLEPRLEEPAPVELISGGFRWQQPTEFSRAEPEQRSALLRLAAGEQQPSSWLDKHRLVPLGEWVPLAGLIRWSGLSAVGGVEPGPPSRLLARPAGAIAGAICYELSDGSALAAATADGAGWLLASANLDPYPLQLQRQFQALAQLRAIETGRWLVSVANTGPSLLVTARGRVLAALPPGQPATALFAVSRLAGLTPYDRWREAPLLLLVLAAAGWRWRRRS